MHENYTLTKIVQPSDAFVPPPPKKDLGGRPILYINNALLAVLFFLADTIILLYAPQSPPDISSLPQTKI